MIRYSQVTRDIGLLPKFISYYEHELDEAKKECSIKGVVETKLKLLPGITEHRFNQLQEIDAVLEYLNIQLRQIRQIYYKKYLEKYNKALSSSDAKHYAYAEQDVIDYEVLINEVALLRNKFTGIIKAFENKSFTVNSIIKLHTAGMEDIII